MGHLNAAQGICIYRAWLVFLNSDRKSFDGVGFPPRGPRPARRFVSSDPLCELGGEHSSWRLESGLQFAVSKSTDDDYINIITEDTMPAYFCGPEPWARTHGYGFTGCFALVRQAWLHDRWLVGLLQAL